MLKKDNVFFGVLIGTLLPGVLFGLSYLINYLLDMTFQISTLFVISVAINVVTMRYFMVSKNLDKTGKGILFITFVAAIIYIAFFLET